MRQRFSTYLVLFLAIITLQNCSTKKNTFIHRGFHNLTARYNGYYYSNESIKDGIYKIEKNNKENFEKVLPVYILPTNENAKTTFPDFDKAIKKSSLVIQRHAIKDKKDNEIPTAGKWIDNNWINIGIAHFYKREFFSGIESFEYVARTYKTKDKYTALLWSAKSYNEIGSVSNSAPLISLLTNDKKLPKKIKNQLYPVRGDYFIKRGLNKEAIAVLVEASNQKGMINGIKRKQRARYAFIAAQLSEQDKDYKRARQYYTKAIGLKPSYDMVFYATIKLARLFDTKNQNTVKLKKQLLKMTKDAKNSDYLDVIYYTLGEIEEKEKHQADALVYYKKSAQSSVSNPNQKALSFLKLGEIYFDRTDYTASGAYYDSTVTVLPKDHPDYMSISSRKKTLEVLVGYIKTIQHEDSLQSLARMDESTRNKAIDKQIQKLIDEEQRKKEELEAALAKNQNPLSSTTNTNVGSSIGLGGSGWYFYNQTTISFGISDFAKKWGNRKLEDNWRRSQKGVVIEDPNSTATNTSTNTTKNGTAKSNDPKKTREYYLKRLPLNDSLIKVSDGKIIEADYLLGSTYREELNNNKKAIAAFEDLNKRYADHKYRLSCYYHLYRLYQALKNQEQSDFYKEKLLSEYPNSEYSKLIKNPKYAEERNAQRSEVEKTYASTYEAYLAANYESALQQSTEANNKFGKTDFFTRFEFIRAMSLGKAKGIDSMESALKQLTILYPKAEVTPRANEILLSIKKQKNPDMFSNATSTNVAVADTFKINFDSEHFAMVISPDDPKMANPFKSAIGDFNAEYYSNKTFEVTSNLYGISQQMILVKSFPDAKEAQTYIDNLKGDTKIYKGAIIKEAYSFFIISAKNVPLFFKKANASSYRAFYEEAYKTIFAPSK